MRDEEKQESSTQESVSQREDVIVGVVTKEQSDSIHGAVEKIRHIFLGASEAGPDVYSKGGLPPVWDAKKAEHGLVVERYTVFPLDYANASARSNLIGDLSTHLVLGSAISQGIPYSAPSSFGKAVEEGGSDSPPVVSSANTIVRVEVDEDPLTVEQMGLLFSTLSTLATKYWLISQGRFADLIEFTKSHDERFVREAQAVVTRISYNSPLNFDIKLSATDAAQGMVTTIDGIVQGKQRLKQMELATHTKESELHQAELRFAEELKQLQQQEAFEQEKRRLELTRQQLEVERLRLEVEQQRLGFLEARLEMQSKSLDHAFEIARKVISQLHPQADEATKRMLVQTYVGEILQLTEISFTSVTVVEVEQASPVDNKDKEQ